MIEDAQDEEPGTPLTGDEAFAIMRDTLLHVMDAHNIKSVHVTIDDLQKVTEVRELIIEESVDGFVFTNLSK